MDILRRSLARYPTLFRTIRAAYRMARPALRPFTARAELRRWRLAGRPSPPPHIVKQEMVARMGKRFSLSTLVETGTFRGEMIAAQLRRFERIISIELHPGLHEAARRRFEGRPNVMLVQGDSAIVLPTLLPTLAEPALFWLDGHYSGEGTASGDAATPIIDEVRAILLQQTEHCFLIDDARLFGTDPAYPAIEELRSICLTGRPDWDFIVAADIIRFHPHTAEDLGVD